MVRRSPFLFASRVQLQHTCTPSAFGDCGFVSQALATLFEEHPHYYLRSLDLTDNGISTKEAFRLLIAVGVDHAGRQRDRRRLPGVLQGVYPGQHHLPRAAAD